ncbi:hypothetical protein R50073_30240 [Maricurvus nonylphenolicus]|uniref:type VI secretion system contractile sheath domain-containing protein n=1 Tax=Maricurvus nonylphenolicus TaxID=1008307 RepID=UPI0036F3FE0F
MPRSTISTGHTRFGQEPNAQKLQNNPLRIAILGDFTGRQSRNQCEPQTLASRNPIRITKDNFERVFENAAIRLKLPSCEEYLCFSEFDDLHPDYLYERLPLFTQFKKLKKQLLNPELLPTAAAEIQQWASFKASAPILENSAENSGDTNYGSMLDAMLSETNGLHHYQASPDGQIDQLIKDIVSPYISPKADPRQTELLEAVEAASAEALRKLLHHSNFQQLEASWRSLHFLIKRLDGHSGLILDIIDISKEELLADLTQADSDLEQAGIFKTLVANQAQAGQTPYHAFVGDFFIEPNEADLGLVIDMSTIAQSTGAIFISAADTALAGCPSLVEADNPENWSLTPHQLNPADWQDAWQAVRDFEASEHCLLSAPRFLLRAPYGLQSATIDSFDFEELPKEHTHEFYLWGNSAYLQAYRLAQGYIDHGWSIDINQAIEVDQLPLHIFKQDGESCVTPCAEINMTDTTAKALSDTGISVVRSIRHQDKVIVTAGESLAFSRKLQSLWNNG